MKYAALLFAVMAIAGCKSWDKDHDHDTAMSDHHSAAACCKPSAAGQAADCCKPGADGKMADCCKK